MPQIKPVIEIDGLLAAGDDEGQQMLLESMLVECVDDPRPLLTSTLGRNHPLIVKACERQSAPPSKADSFLDH